MKSNKNLIQGNVTGNGNDGSSLVQRKVEKENHTNPPVSASCAHHPVCKQHPSAYSTLHLHTGMHAHEICVQYCVQSLAISRIQFCLLYNGPLTAELKPLPGSRLHSLVPAYICVSSHVNW